MRGRLAALLLLGAMLLRLLLPGVTERAAAALRGLLAGERGWESVETLGRSVAERGG